jgi:beta-N-acetylhexosaminidase
MKALAQGPTQVVDLIAAVRADVDLLLGTPDRALLEQATDALSLAARRELFDPAELARSAARVTDLRTWVGSFDNPDVEVVGNAEHQALARDLAERSITLVRDDAGLLPLRLAPGARILAVMPKPANLTPADSSERVEPGLARALRARGLQVDEMITALPPTAEDIAAVHQRAASADLVILGTLSAWFDPAQAELVEAVTGSGTPVVTVALRFPFDLARYPAAQTHVCTYSILPPSLDALAAALFGDIPFRGRLPAAIPGLYPTGHGLSA